jgi:GAF domain-containing protein
LPTEVGTRYPRRALDFIGLLPLFFDDIQTDSRVGPAMQELAQRLEFKAAAALPLWTSNQQLGTLFFEAEEAYHFEEEEMQPYVALARQVAIALENRRLLEETRLALVEVEATQRRYTVQSWEVYQARTPAREYEKVREDVTPLAGVLPAGVSEAIQNRQTTVLTPSPALLQTGGNVNNPLPAETNLIVPLTIRDEIIGVLGLQEMQGKRPWLPEEIELVQAIAEEIALAAENIRLLDETQQRAAREQRVNEIGEKIRAAQTLEEALQIAVKEVGLSLKAPQTAVKLDIENE